MTEIVNKLVKLVVASLQDPRPVRGLRVHPRDIQRLEAEIIKESETAAAPADPTLCLTFMGIPVLPDEAVGEGEPTVAIRVEVDHVD